VSNHRHHNAGERKSNYAELLKSPQWQRKRLEIMQRDNWQCVICLDGNSTLNVHHKEYLRGHKPWEYGDHALMTLCEACHELCHFTGDKSELKQHIMERHGHGTITDYGVQYLFLEHRLEAL